jgi:hypothetical protein
VLSSVFEILFILLILSKFLLLEMPLGELDERRSGEQMRAGRIGRISGLVLAISPGGWETRTL